jgi:hypothetical protein
MIPAVQAAFPVEDVLSGSGDDLLLALPDGSPSAASPDSRTPDIPPSFDVRFGLFSG